MSARQARQEKQGVRMHFRATEANLARSTLASGTSVQHLRRRSWMCDELLCFLP